MDQTRQKILESAGKCFAEKGFTSTTVREICGLAGVNIAAVNYHFGDKRRLYIEAVKQAHCHKGEPPQFNWDRTTAAEQKLEEFVRGMMSRILDDQEPSWQVELLMREMARPTEACVELVRSFIGPMFDTLLSIVSEILPPDLPLIERHLHAFTIIAQCLLYRYHRPIGRLLVGDEEYRALFDVDLLTRHIARTSLAALHSRALEARSREEVPA
jgi:AcrR family transcriptional regulator